MHLKFPTQIYSVFHPFSHLMHLLLLFRNREYVNEYHQQSMQFALYLSSRLNAQMESSPERDNFVKLSYILLDVVARHLREYFVKVWDQNYPNEKWHDDVAKRDLKLQSLLVTRDGRQKQDIYSQKILKGNEREWDITTVIKALLDSGFKLIDGCRPPDQRTIPLRESEEIEIIRGIRNTDYGHISNMSCSFDAFMDIMEEIKSVAEDLFSNEAKKENYRIEVSPSTPNMREQVDKLRKGKFHVRNKYLFNLTYPLF